jgi:hypothetical protein
VILCIFGSRPPLELRKRHADLEKWYEANMPELEQAITASGFTDISKVITGKAKGFDELGARWAEGRGIDPEEMKAIWGIGPYVDRAAGIKRNIRMSKVAEAGLGFWDEASRGTAHMIATMAALGKPVFVWSIKPNSMLQCPMPWIAPEPSATQNLRARWLDR